VTTTVAAAPVQQQASSDYSGLAVAPATGSTYVGTTSQITVIDPYQAVQQQVAPAPAPQAAPQRYEPVSPTYTQQYDAGTAYTTTTPEPAPAPNYTVAAPAPAQQAPVTVGGYEYTTAPQQPAAPDYYDLNAQTAAAAAAAIAAPAPAPAYVSQQPAMSTAGHFIQVGAFTDPARASKLVNKLGSSGQQAFIVPAQVRGKLYHRVRIAAASKRDARIVRDQVRDLGYYEARVVKG
jgi:cell division septation protein DedD